MMMMLKTISIYLIAIAIQVASYIRKVWGAFCMYRKGADRWLYIHRRVLIHMHPWVFNIHGSMSTYTCANGCLYMCQWVLIHVPMGAYTCTDGCYICINGCLDVI